MAKTVHIGATELVSFDGFEHVPTALYYDGPDQFRIGHAALTAATPQKRANANFKLELGRTDREKDVLRRHTFGTAHGGQKSAVQFANHFITHVMERASEWVSQSRLAPATIVMVAEPLQFYLDQEDVNHDWLTNYRFHIRQILEKRFSRVEFLPEPFAVFLFYRYGIRHHLVSKSKRYISLVLDFGGGTFDASIIETSKDGDLIKTGAKHAKPYAASSEPIGGGYINRILAEQLLIKVCPTSDLKKKLRTAFNGVDGWRASGLYDQLNPQNQAAMDWLDATIQAVEAPKIKLSRSIDNWDLDAELAQAVSIRIPENPLDGNSALVDVELTAVEFREIFVHRIWATKLKQAVKRALDRAKTELKGKEINLLLLSGGSANIGWLGRLLSKDFEDVLDTADQLTLTADFQRIVATGLSVEGVRRNALDETLEAMSEAAAVFPASAQAPVSAPPAEEVEADPYTLAEEPQSVDDAEEEEDSSAASLSGTTYNQVSLFLGPDDLPPKPLRFKSLDGFTSGSSDRLSVLLPSGTSLQEKIDRTLVWKVRLPRAPKHSLRFHFSRGDAFPVETQDLYNVDSQVFTGRNSAFGSHIWVELTVAEDGTCHPRFVYARDPSGNATSFRDGTPFAIDMTIATQRRQWAPPLSISTPATETPMSQPPSVTAVAAPTPPPPATVEVAASSAVPGGFAFFGLDFGSTNTAVSYVSSRSIEICASRGTEWQQLEDLVDRLPYSVAGPAKAYCAPRDHKERLNAAYDFLEATLGFFASVAYAEYARVDGKGELLKSFIVAKRSLGPVKALLDGAMEALDTRSPMLKSLKKSLDEHRGAIDKTIRDINQFRHKIIPESQVQEEEVCNLVANLCGTFTGNRYLGYFETAVVSPFTDEVSGEFRVAHGSRLFLKKLRYRCVGAKADQIPYLIDLASKVALPLAPLMLWRRHEDQLGLWLLDKAGHKSGYDFKESEGGGVFNMTKEHDSAVVQRLDSLRKGDLSYPAPVLIEVEKGWSDG